MSPFLKASWPFRWSDKFDSFGIAAGTFAEPTLVTAARLEDPAEAGAGPHPTTLRQYPPFYDIDASAVPERAVGVAVCLPPPSDPLAPPEEVLGRLVMGHTDPETGAFALLPSADAPFLDCGGAGKVAGQTGSFSTFGSTDPVPVRQLAFAGNDLHLIDEDGANLVRLTNVQVGIQGPRWSPDGSQIVFVSKPRDVDSEILLTNADGSGTIFLTEPQMGGTWPDWSPDGSRIVFTRGRDTWTMDADGSNQMLVVEDGLFATWSPDGSRILFVTASGPNLYSALPDGSDVRQLTSDWEWEPVWSPDGSRILFHTFRDGNTEIYVMNADGSGQTNLTQNAAEDSDPAWSPDGSRIAFHSDRDGNWEIYVMNADGTGTTRLTNDPARDCAPAWSPNGDRIAFGRQDTGSCGDGGATPRAEDIYLIDPDGSNLVNLTAELSGKTTNPFGAYLDWSWRP